MVLLCIFMGLGPLAQWKRTRTRTLWQRTWLAGGMALIIAGAIPLLYDGEWNLRVSLGLAAALWIVLPMLRGLLDRMRQGTSKLAALRKQSLAYWGMLLAHLGVAVTIVGVSVVANYSVERNVRMGVGDTASLAGYTFTLTELGERRGPNFIADTARLEVQRGDDDRHFVMMPEKRLYLATGMPMTDVALRPGPLRDLYVAMGEDLGDGSWALRLQYKPLVRWLWLGGLLMAIGGILAVIDRRYRRAATARDPERAALTNAREASA
ncbi:cytochrome c-type biogenesis protein CcmF [Halomonas elongata]|uniref:Cytochrome c-type biogenesis protein CcmF n=2 Tax=Halomonas elongata TaxID=2746 RepID=A0A1B8NWV5_HALEL|nr:cytochrome c-type biogenesis protein CcmF [Halomonas elongata]